MKTMTTPPFYMVYAEGKNTPVYKHDSYDSAKSEAERLSESLGVKCYVLTPISSHKCVRFESEEFDLSQLCGLPF